MAQLDSREGGAKNLYKGHSLLGQLWKSKMDFILVIFLCIYYLVKFLG